MTVCDGRLRATPHIASVGTACGSRIGQGVRSLLVSSCALCRGPCRSIQARRTRQACSITTQPALRGREWSPLTGVRATMDGACAKSAQDSTAQSRLAVGRRKPVIETHSTPMSGQHERRLLHRSPARTLSHVGWSPSVAGTPLGRGAAKRPVEIATRALGRARLQAGRATRLLRWP